ncbi:MAG: toxin-activating lysine-acyltransferase [Parvibaculum sp.]|nr:toxin-activating lysine-acyltransferase [Parvibaculum sp.]
MSTSDMDVEEKNSQQQAGPRSNAEALGQIFILLAQSKLHRSWRVVEMERYLMPALQHRQYRIYFDKTGIPFGYVSWAWFTKEVEDRYLAGGYVIQPTDWIGGDRAWIMDWIAPNGGTRYMVKDIRSLSPTVWKYRPVKAIRPNKVGPGQKVVVFGRPSVRAKAEWKVKLINEHLGVLGTTNQ